MMARSQGKTRSNVLRLFFLVGCAILVLVKGSGSYTANTSRRERSLDHWDAETLAAYLGVDVATGKPLGDGKENTYVGYDAAVMFYAQWCKNCHNFAPLWDTIANMLHAGTTDSNLVMALFNCELDETHMKLCTAAGVTHYPTLLFVGSGPFHDGGPLSPQGKNKAGKTLPRTVKYPGNLALGDAVLDWVKTMQGLSTWHKWSRHGWIHWLRQKLMIPGLRSKKPSSSAKEKALPVGVPSSNMQLGGDQQPPVSTKELEAKVKSMESQIKILADKNKELDLTANHAGWIIDSFLFPNNINISESTKEVDNKYAHVDVFEVMTDKNAWDVPLLTASPSEVDNVEEQQNNKILKSCVADITLDYCTRASTKLTNDYLTELEEAKANDENAEYPTFLEMETHLKEIIKQEEPFCSVIATCYKNDFSASTPECRPATCPLLNESGCRYVSATCLSTDIQEEYRQAIFEDEELNKNDKAKKSSGSAWGVKS